MVTRKALAPLATSQAPEPSNSTNNPPYPVSPDAKTRSPATELDRTKTVHSINSVYSPDLNSSPAFDLIGMDQARQRPLQTRRDSDVSSHGTWDSDDDNEERRGEGEGEKGKKDVAHMDLPAPLRITKSQQDIHQQAQAQPRDTKDELPAILKPGSVGGARPFAQESEDGMRYDDEEAQANPSANAPPVEGNLISSRENKNPYRQQPSVVGEMSQGATWEFKPALLPTQPSNAPPPPPPPVEMSTSPKTPADELRQMSLGGEHHPRPEPKPFETQEILAIPQSRPPMPSVVDEAQEFRSNNPWRTPSQERHPNQQPSILPSESQELQQPSIPSPAPPKALPPRYAPPPGPPPKGFASTSLIDHQDPPSRSTSAQHRPPPIVTPAATAIRSSESIPETPGTRDRRQRSEHYQIKHINWSDSSRGSSIRQSPILTQNANGPCPLLALVNALVLSTPQDMHTALVETLSTREQVSLGLLLDAVFDELMSGRRSGDAQALPDVGELYAFLLALHTGMNVNPRFVAPKPALDQHVVREHAHQAGSNPGDFEQTKEMRLYSTFNIPLIHGWIAPKDTPAYMAFERCAPTFEEAQNVQFLEAELEDKSRTEGLPSHEQQMLDDIKTIKAFLNTWPTQLTDYGLESVSASLQPGQIAILFRNDHFSTLYKEPRHGALMTLVTDAGYGGHDEIVWESLVDVHGAASELFSGDFRIVGDAAQTQDLGARTPQNGAASPVAPPLPGPRPSQAHTDDGTTADGLAVPPNEPHRKTSEQEDHDLALALQLQEEEEDQERQASRRRQREQELSEHFLSIESTEGPRPPIPPRRSANPTGRTTAPPPNGRLPVTRPTAATDDPDAPPTYEQSASDRPYRPAGATAGAGLQQGNPLSAYDALRRQQSSFTHQQQGSGSIPPDGMASNAGPSPPSPFARGRGGDGRRASSNRVRRRSSQLAPPGTYGSGYGINGGSGVPGQGQGMGMGGMPAPGGGSAGAAGRPPGPVIDGQAAGVKDAEERCTVM
ncbi:hypothetical protein LTR62_005238 [Meristemomyces frigidus]|uniref:MINDY deubiquitinase domain-containing protein n=1 Tax=Meristemomyces frigidus TaxID=1508187 RepID=A0AAN7TPY5_9PEZI|nr:hypothetical protein LTR62_005238 [Meristemomyces frigidus]